MKAVINGINYYYEDLGTGAPILFVHGLGENGASWAHQVETFKKAFRVIVPDLRGHRYTDDGPLDKITIEWMAKDLVALLDHLGIGEVHIVGLSMGGLVVQEFAKHFQARIKTLALCDATAYADETAKGKLASRLEMIKSKSMDEMADFIVTACLPPKETLTAEQQLEWQRVYDEAFAVFCINRKEAYMASTIATFSVDYRDVLPNIHKPTLVMCGALDRATPVSASQYLHEHIANAQLAVLPGAGHLSKIEVPHLFNAALLQFLQPYEPAAPQLLAALD